MSEESGTCVGCGWVGHGRCLERREVRPSEEERIIK